MPYSHLPATAYWKLCRDDPGFRVSEIYAPKFVIEPGQKVGTAGSCFAQNISRYLQRSPLSFHQGEAAPRGMPDAVARRFGYGLYSARYGNIYTARQLRQLLADARDGTGHDAAIWEREGRFFDALRPGVEPEGLALANEVRAHRLDHLRAVKALMREMDVFVFTLGLTETWEDVETGVVFPSAPGVIAGRFDEDIHRFVNQKFLDVFQDMRAAINLLREVNPDIRIILTVSPVPLTATATGQHVLAATTYSKSVLRAVAGELVGADDSIDYFPSFEIVTGLPFGAGNYAENLRNVTEEGVDRVMRVFFAAHDAEIGETPEMPRAQGQRGGPQEDICEEVLLEAFAPR